MVRGGEGSVRDEHGLGTVRVAGVVLWDFDGSNATRGGEGDLESVN